MQPHAANPSIGRLLITGAAGFIGSEVARQSVDKGLEVGVLISPDTPPNRLADILKDVTVLEGRLEDEEGLRRHLRAFKPDGCIHLAWYAEPGLYLTSLENINALKGSLTLLQQLIDCGCRHIVGVGTCAEYNLSGIEILKEDSPTRPDTLYAASKLSLALIGSQLSEHIGFAWARLFYLYGPFEDPRRVTPMLVRALGDGKPFPATLGEQVRDYLHVADAAGALLHLALGRADGVYNVAAGQGVTIREYMSLIEKLLGKTGLVQFGELPYRDWEPMRVVGDNQRLRQTGWAPAYTLETGLRHTIEWWQAHPAPSSSAT